MYGDLNLGSSGRDLFVWKIEADGGLSLALVASETS
jgi:hypothetical protein